MSISIATPAGGVTHELTIDDVSRIHAGCIARGRTSIEAFQGTRTELHENLQASCPFPLSSKPEEMNNRVVTPEERDSLVAAQRDMVSDEHRIASDRARAKDPTHVDAHHWLQKEHGKALWAEADRLLALAGVSP